MSKGKEKSEADRLEDLANGDELHAGELEQQGQTSSADYYKKRAEWRRRLAREARSFAAGDVVELLPAAALMGHAEKLDQVEEKEVKRKLKKDFHQ